jgi:hypothetical protein
MQTWQEWSRLAFSPDGRDTCAGVSDEEIGRAIKRTGNLLVAAELLTDRHGRIIARQDIAAHVEASPELRRTYEIAREAQFERAIANSLRRIAENRDLRALQQERRRGPRCGARCRDGHPCGRRPVPGRTRCPSHGGRTPTARRTPAAPTTGR